MPEEPCQLAPEEEEWFRSQLELYDKDEEKKSKRAMISYKKQHDEEYRKEVNRRRAERKQKQRNLRGD